VEEDDRIPPVIYTVIRQGYKCYFVCLLHADQLADLMCYVSKISK
jgi:hypothetical protein